MIKNKKGEEEEGLIGNTLGTILGITASVIIIVFIYIAISRVWSDQAFESAQQIADTLKARIEALKPGQETTITIQGSENLNGWTINTWDKNDDNRPDTTECFASNCLCICEGEGKDSCKKKGICRKLEIEGIPHSNYLPAIYIQQNLLALRTKLCNDKTLLIQDQENGPYWILGDCGQ